MAFHSHLNINGSPKSPNDATRDLSKKLTPFSKLPLPISKSAGSSIGKLSHFKKLEALAKSEVKDKRAFAAAQGREFEGIPWVDRNLPKDLSELFVHKKKVEDVQLWLENASNSKHNKSKICLLTGPAGSGKTATVVLLAKENETEVMEWINPMSLTHYNGFTQGDEIQGRSQSTIFADFVLRSAQYSSLPMKGRPVVKKRIILVEDLPNVFYRDTNAFHNILRNYAAMGICPLVFIVPDSVSGDTNPIKLFPKDLIQELNIQNIQFNPVAHSFMVKFLTIICSRESVLVDKTILNGVAVAAGGDIRCAINTLQFKILQEKIPVGTGFKRPYPKRDNRLNGKIMRNDQLTQKDESLFLFHGIGKVLYAKRDRPTLSTVELQLCSRLVNERRMCPLLEDIEDVTSRIGSSPETFINFLQQNYTSVLGNLTDVVKASAFLADAAVLLSDWTFDGSGTDSRSYKVRETREDVALSVAIRGLMHSNQMTAPSKYRGFRKPIWSDLHIRTLKSVESVRCLFVADGSVQQNFYTEILPFCAKLSNSFLRSDQKVFVNEIGLFKKERSLRNQDILNEKDDGEDDADIAMNSEDGNETLHENSRNSNACQPKHKAVAHDSAYVIETVEAENPEEFLIEDFDD